jgi:hypothetical protein
MHDARQKPLPLNYSRLGQTHPHFEAIARCLCAVAGFVGTLMLLIGGAGSLSFLNPHLDATFAQFLEVLGLAIAGAACLYLPFRWARSASDEDHEEAGNALLPSDIQIYREFDDVHK